MTATRLDAAFAVATAQILRDIDAGLVPADVTEFRRLHDFVDANEYGDWNDVMDLSVQEWTDFGNDLQNRLDAWLKAGRPDADKPTTVQIPGNVIATYVDGRVTEVVFWPHGSAAGYFGPSANVWEGDADLDVEGTDGPFWTAIQAYLAGDTERIDWRE